MICWNHYRQDIRRKPRRYHRYIGITQQIIAAAYTMKNFLEITSLALFIISVYGWCSFSLAGILIPPCASLERSLLPVTSPVNSPCFRRYHATAQISRGKWPTTSYKSSFVKAAACLPLVLSSSGTSGAALRL